MEAGPMVDGGVSIVARLLYPDRRAGIRIV